TVGQPFAMQDKQLALFIQSEAPGLYNHYGRQMIIQIASLVVMFLLILCFRPWRQDMRGWVQILDAIRRIAKGDFKVVIGTGKPLPGQLGQLVNSLNDMAVELDVMEQMRQTFISNVSHEIQSPLTSIRGFAQALQQEEGLGLDQRKHYYTIIETESARLSKLSDNLLKLTSLESDKHPFEIKRYRLDKQLRSMILACEPQWVEKDILMDVDLGEINITADEDLMSQVWMNMLSNSIKFTPEGGTITIEAEYAEDGAVIRISDNGTGIAQEDLPYIFERFFKGDKSRNRQTSGSGLGLSIVKRIIDMHGGEVSVSSTCGIGTTFTVKLPAPGKSSPA
ncbi:HAMP domain-containing histidine kinase, partial [Paenibacillus sepulcri]|nr:HAMP domain-containing histidine kinase [Paenibacillus sepulcri]